MAAETLPKAVPLLGNPRPRIAPPIPAKSEWKEFAAFSADIGLSLRPWQETVARYLTATSPGDRWLYREVALIVARQNGKTALLVPLIVSRLLAGQRIMHTAQNRDLPREVFDQVAEIVSSLFPTGLRERNGRTLRPRFANGQEEIKLRNGGSYRIVAPNRGGARGPSNDLVIIDELREMEDFDFIAAAKPTLTVSPKPQMLYLSNAGTEMSVVLNALKQRAHDDPSVAYLEWSAAPDRPVDDPRGWCEANPSIGHDDSLIETLRSELISNRLAGTLAIFETEHLCRWVTTVRPRLVSDIAWQRAHSALEKARRPYMAVTTDGRGRRASVAMSWQQSDGTIALELVADVSADGLDTAALGRDLSDRALRAGVGTVGYGAWTDAELARYFRKTKSIDGRDLANASQNFVSLIDTSRLRWGGKEDISDDLAWTSRKSHEAGSWTATPADDERSITAVLAAIRAVWLASGPQPAAPRIY